MSEVTSIEPENFVKNSNSHFFQIFLATKPYLLCWTGKGFENVEINGFQSMNAFKKDDVVEQYYEALRMAKSEKSELYTGKLEIVSLPTL